MLVFASAAKRVRGGAMHYLIAVAQERGAALGDCDDVVDCIAALSIHSVADVCRLRLVNRRWSRFAFIPSFAFIRPANRVGNDAARHVRAALAMRAGELPLAEDVVMLHDDAPVDRLILCAACETARAENTQLALRFYMRPVTRITGTSYERDDTGWVVNRARPDGTQLDAAAVIDVCPSDVVAREIGRACATHMIDAIAQFTEPRVCALFEAMSFAARQNIPGRAEDGSMVFLQHDVRCPLTIATNNRWYIAATFSAFFEGLLAARAFDADGACLDAAERALRDFAYVAAQNVNNHNRAHNRRHDMAADVMRAYARNESLDDALNAYSEPTLHESVAMITIANHVRNMLRRCDFHRDAVRPFVARAPPALVARVAAYVAPHTLVRADRDAHARGAFVSPHAACTDEHRLCDAAYCVVPKGVWNVTPPPSELWGADAPFALISVRVHHATHTMEARVAQTAYRATLLATVLRRPDAMTILREACHAPASYTMTLSHHKALVYFGNGSGWPLASPCARYGGLRRLLGFVHVSYARCEPSSAVDNDTVVLFCAFRALRQALESAAADVTRLVRLQNIASLFIGDSPFVQRVWRNAFEGFAWCRTSRRA